MPIILVGSQLDLRADQRTIQQLARNGESPVELKEGYAVAEKIGAYAYLECSALTREGIREVFEMATRAAFLTKKNIRQFEGKNLQDKFKSLKSIKLKKDQPRLSKLIHSSCSTGARDLWQ